MKPSSAQEQEMENNGNRDMQEEARSVVWWVDNFPFLTQISGQVENLILHIPELHAWLATKNYYF